jgi:hypothetical protein
MRKRTLTLFMLLILQGMAFGQNVTISGYVIDAQNNERIMDAYVIELNSGMTEITNAYGFFSIRLKKSNKPYRLIFSNISYKTDTLRFSVLKDTLINVKLMPGKMLAEVNIRANKTIPIEKRNEMGVLNIPMKQIDMLPALGGERDIIKAYQLMPGVQSGNEGSSSLLVRGGSNDQNLILIDDVPVYYINHLGGFVSVFNNNAIKTTRLYKGGFPARYGGRLSSVLDVRMKDGNNKKFGGSASIGLISANAMVEGPLVKNKSSYLISYRRFLYDLLMRPITKMTEKNSSAGYYFQDFNLKLNHIFSPKNRLFFSLYFGDDKMISTYKEKEDGFTNYSKYKEQWGNFLTALRWNHLFGDKIFGNFTLSYTRYRFRTALHSEFEQDSTFQTNHNTFFTGIYDFSFHSDFEFFLYPHYNLRFGTLTTNHTFVPDNIDFKTEVNGQIAIKQSFSAKTFHSFETAAYVENIFQAGKKLKFNVGLRFSAYGANTQTFLSLEPRFTASWLVGNKQALKVSFSKMHQNVHMLSNSGAGVPVDFWYPASAKAPPSVSWQYNIGYAATLFGGFELSIEGFYKKMNRLTTFKPGASYFGINRTFDQKTEIGGRGTVYGVDFLLQKTTGKVTGWVGYTWMKNYRQFDHINNGEPYPFKYDRRNDISIVFNYHISKKVDFSATWVYGTGEALTLPVAKYYIPEILPGSQGRSAYMQEIYVYTKKNAFRAKDYHRLDIGFNFRKKKRWGERIWNLSIYNVYNRKNPYAYYFSGESITTPSGTTNQRYLVQQSLFPFIPSVSYTVHF